MEGGNVLRQDINFQGLFKKLGHDLEEIRVRALDNLLSKLEHKLVCDADLVNERHLLIRLIEWFNFPSSTKHKDVLFLLQRLSQHSAAAEILQDIGAIEFLGKLRTDVASSLQPVIDQVLENTMRLPETRAEDHVPQCFYQRHTEDTESVQQHIMSGWDSMGSQTSSSSVQLSPLIPDAPHIASGRDVGMGYFQQQQQQQQPPVSSQLVQQNSEAVIQGRSESFQLSAFPWLALTPTDRHVIQSTNSSLQSREPHLLVSSCEFLSDVVFQDFPAEIFLQRPNIVKNLLSILGSPSNSNTNLTMSAARTLGDLAFSLRARMRYYQDPTLCTPKQEFTSSSSSPFSASPSTESNQSTPSEPRPSAIGVTDTRHRGDGRDGDSSTSSSSSRASSIGLGPDMTTTREETDIEDAPALQFVQLSLPQFCALVLEKALPLLKTGVESVIVHLLYLLKESFSILVAVVSPCVWTDTSPAAREIVEKITGCLSVIAELMNYHHYGNSELENNKSGLIPHRLAYLGICGFLNQLLKDLIPFQKARSLLPENLVKAINVAVYDESLSHSYPDIQITLLSVLQLVDTNLYQVYVDTAKVAQSMHKSCKFLMLCQQEAYKGNKELATLAEASLSSLQYHLHLPLVTEFVKLTSSVCASVTVDQDLQGRCKQVLLKYLANPLVQVRQQAYNTMLQIIKGAVCVNEASDPNSEACRLGRFLFDTDILYQITVFGLDDKDVKVAKTAADLMCYLLNSSLMMTSHLWNEFMDSLLRPLPVLQSYCDQETSLGKCLLTMSDPQITKSHSSLSSLEKLRATLRHMFSSDVRTRAEALKRVAWFLSNEKDSTKKLPVFSELDVTNLTNIFVMETPRSVDDDLGRSVFQIDGLRKVNEIFKSMSVDPGVKKSAADQLAIILQDHNLHSAFKRDGGLESVLEHLKLAILRDQGPSKIDYLPYLNACVTILRYLIHHDYTLRHRLATDQEIYTCLIRAAFINQRDERTCYEAAHTLTLLLFDEVAKFDMGGGQNPVVTFSIPKVLKKRYRLPFRPVCHHEVSPHQGSLPAEPDLLANGPPAEMLKVVWNVAWHGGMDKLLSHLKLLKTKQDKFTEFSVKLHLTCSDRVIIQATHLRQGMQEAVFDISNATSHKGVSTALNRLLTYLVTAQGHPGVDDVFNLDWFTTIGRFLKVTPSLTADESLLQEVLKFICIALKLTNGVPDNTLQWLGEMLYQPSGTLIGLLHRASVKGEARDVPENVNIKRTLDKELLSFIATYNSKLPYLLCRRLKIQQLRGDLSHQLIQRLNVTDAPHFYNLASLEGTLQCLMHITARPGWSHESTELDSGALCSQVLHCLLEVVSAFHIGRGGTSMSYMGKGVTKSATLCLRHLAHEMASYSDDKNWARQWSHLQQKSDVSHSHGMTGDSGLIWMLTLWAYRDPEVRAAGLGIAVALTSTEPGRIVMTSHCKHIPGGIWGAAFSILLDQAECSMVRQQAALLLVNMTSQTMPCGSVELEQNVWQGPIVTDTEFEVSLVGLTALLALIHHSQFYQEMLVLLCNFYAQPTIQPVSVLEVPVSHLSSTESESTLSTVADFGTDGLQSTSGSNQPRSRGRGHIHHTSNSSGSKTRHSTTDPTGNSSSSTLTGEQLEYQSIATPSLVSSVCQFLRNLVILAPQDTFTCLKKDSYVQVLTNLVDTNLLDAYMTEMGEGCSDQLELVFCDLLHMYASILDLLRACVVYDTPIRQEVLANEDFIRSTAALLTIRFQGSADVEGSCQVLWSSVLSFLTVLLQLQGASALHSFTMAAHTLWTSTAETLCSVLEKRLHLNKKLFDNCLRFLSILFSEEGKLVGRQPQLAEDTITITGLLNTPLKSDTKEQDQGEVTTGSQLCKVLVNVYEHSCLKSTDYKEADRVHAATALRTLLAISSSAKAKALQLGLVESVIDHVKQTHNKLNMESLQPGKPNTKKKEDPLMSDLVLTFDLLRNFIFQNLEAKMACYYSGLHNILHRLWAWCQLDMAVMSSALSLLTTYIAHCPTATSSLAYTTTATSTGGQKTQQLSNNSLVHCLIRLTGRDGIKDSVLRTLFSLLATLTLSSEGRNIVFKSNFLREFLSLNPRKSKKTKHTQNMELFWLELLVNLSFSVEGQQMLLKTGDCVNLLLDFVEYGQGKVQECATLILRNMCCHSSNKPKLLACDKLLPHLLECLTSDNTQIQCVAASALWALVFNNQKAKVMMKNANVIPKLQEVMNNINNHHRRDLSDGCLENLQSVIAAVAE
ncbi:rotatin-like [Ylistrum balloti]|uniref:rotatin-like n=1 Tax=Ylistrum balloti TaxID=509963 RepID=UPI002905CF3E|nr:rotatin-like [Ylistrum balloti]